jgi:hypothetical protein
MAYQSKLTDRRLDSSQRLLNPMRITGKGPPLATIRNPAWAELLQLVPILTLAFPFIVAGEVDLGRANLGFLAGALLSVPIALVVARRQCLQNPILIGTNLWLWLGAIGFNAHVTGLMAWLVRTQAFGLFVAVLGVGLVSAWLLPNGFVACRSDDTRWLRRASLGLLGLTMASVVWSWIFRDNIRLGGGLPFIVLNVARRVLSLRAPLRADT